MDKPIPDPRIATYIEELSKPGIPYVNSTHITLYNLGIDHGKDVIEDLLQLYFKQLRAYYVLHNKESPQ